MNMGCQLGGAISSLAYTLGSRQSSAGRPLSLWLRHSFCAAAQYGCWCLVGAQSHIAGVIRSEVEPA